MGTDLEGLVRLFCSGWEKIPTSEARMAFFLDVLREARQSELLPEFIKVLPSPYQTRVQHDYDELRHQATKALSLVNSLDSIITALKGEAGETELGWALPGLSRVGLEWYSVDYVDSKLREMGIFFGSRTALTIKSDFLSDPGASFVGGQPQLYRRELVDAFFTLAEGYGFIDFRILSENYRAFSEMVGMVGLGFRDIFPYLEELSKAPDKPIVVLLNGKGRKLYLKKKEVSHDELAARINNGVSSSGIDQQPQIIDAVGEALVVEGRELPAIHSGKPASNDTTQGQTGPSISQPTATMLDLAQLEGATDKTGIASKNGYDEATISKIMAGLGIDSLQGKSSLAELVDFLNTHYVVEERALTLQQALGVKQKELYKRLGHLGWQDRSLIRRLGGASSLGYVHAYRRDDETRLIEALKAEMQPSSPAERFYDLLGRKLSRQQVMILLGLDRRPEKEATANLASWERSSSLVPDASGTYAGENIVGFAIRRGRSSLFELLGYSGESRQETLRLAGTDYNNWKSNGRVPVLHQREEKPSNQPTSLVDYVRAKLPGNELAIELALLLSNGGIDWNSAGQELPRQLKRSPDDISKALELLVSQGIADRADAEYVLHASLQPPALVGS